MRTPNEHAAWESGDGHELGLLCLRALSVSASKYRQVASSHRGAVLRAVLIPGVVHLCHPLESGPARALMLAWALVQEFCCTVRVRARQSAPAHAVPADMSRSALNVRRYQ